MPKQKVYLKFNVPQSIMDQYSMQKRKEKIVPHYSFNENIYEAGHQWYRDGFKLEDAPENLKNNSNFVNGYNRAMRLDQIEKKQLAIGEQYFNEGLPVDEWPEIHKNNSIVLRGYENAKNNSRKK